MARILVVEDNDPVRWTLVALLQANGHLVDQAADGQQALLCFARCPTDAVLMDLHMPVMDGFQACRCLRQISQVPILMISTLNQPAIRKQALACGATAFLPKPLELGPLLAWIRGASDNRGGPAPMADRQAGRSSPPSSLPPARPVDPELGSRVWPPEFCVGRLPVPAWPRLPAYAPGAGRSRADVQQAEKFDWAQGPVLGAVCASATNLV